MKVYKFGNCDVLLVILVLDIHTWTRVLLVMVGVFAGPCWWWKMVARA